MSENVNIEGLNKADVFAALYNAAKAQGFGFLHYTNVPMTREEAEAELGRLAQNRMYADYVNGRVMKVSFASDTEIDPYLYDRDNGAGAAQKAIDALRTTQDVNAEEIEHHHLENTRNAAMLVSEHLYDKTDILKRRNAVQVHLGLSDAADLLKPIVDDILDEEA